MKSVGQAIPQQFDAAQNGTILFLPQAFDRLVGHFKDFGGVDDLDSCIGEIGGLEGDLYLRLASDEMQFGDFFAGGERSLDAINDEATTVVAAHDIHYDSHKAKSAARNGIRTALRNYAPAVTVIICRPL